MLPSDLTEHQQGYGKNCQISVFCTTTINSYSNIGSQCGFAGWSSNLEWACTIIVFCGLREFFDLICKTNMSPIYSNTLDW